MACACEDRPKIGICFLCAPCESSLNDTPGWIFIGGQPTIADIQDGPWRVRSPKHKTSLSMEGALKILAKVKRVNVDEILERLRA